MKLGNAKKYDYSKDFKGTDCNHNRAKPIAIEDDWEIGTVDVTIECPECIGVGKVKGRLIYDDEDIEWYDTPDIGKEVDGEVPLT